jgi:hypothetical protein
MIIRRAATALSASRTVSPAAYTLLLIAGFYQIEQVRYTPANKLLRQPETPNPPPAHDRTDDLLQQKILQRCLNLDEKVVIV